MATIIEFPQRPERTKVIQNEIFVAEAEDLAMKTISALLDQALRTQATVSAYQVDMENELKLKC